MKNIKLITRVSGWKEDGHASKAILSGHLTLDESLVEAKCLGFKCNDGALKL